MKIAFFDIDGTLLDVPHGLNAPSRATIEALKAFQDQGNKIVIASARGAVPASLECIFFDGYIFNDGHYIIYEGKVLVDDLFTQEMVQNSWMCIKNTTDVLNLPDTKAVGVIA